MLFQSNWTALFIDQSLLAQGLSDKFYGKFPGLFSINTEDVFIAPKQDRNVDAAIVVSTFLSSYRIGDAQIESPALPVFFNKASHLG